MPLNPLRQNLTTRVAVISASAAVSTMIDLKGLGPRGLAVLVPSAWTAANIGFEISADNSTWIKLKDTDGYRVKIGGILTSEAGYYVASSEVWAVGAYRYLRCVSLNTSTGANENQGSARTLQVSLLY